MLLTAHFDSSELRYESTPPQYQPNVRRLAYLLEELRTIAGVPFRVTSVWRSAERNAEVGGVATSRHLTGEAVDFVPIGLSPMEFWLKLKAAQVAGRAPSWGELELDERDGHVHVTLARLGEKNGEVFIMRSGGSQVLQAGQAAAIGGGIILLVALAVILARRFVA